MRPLARSIRSRPSALATYSEFPLPASVPWVNDWRVISLARHIPSAIRSGVPAGAVCAGDADDGAGPEFCDDADEAGAPPPGAGLWLLCEVSAVARPALAPAITTTLAAASAGAQPRREVRRRRGSFPASLASRNATS